MMYCLFIMKNYINPLKNGIINKHKYKVSTFVSILREKYGLLPVKNIPVTTAFKCSQVPP